MKSILSAGLGISIALSSAVASADSIDKRQQIQAERIEQGVGSGALTEREAAKLERQQSHIQHLENKVKSDGVVTRKEKIRVNAAQDRASHNIAFKKHNARNHR